MADSPIEGIWKHRDKPAWIKISFESGVGTAVVSRHDENPDAEGAEIMIEIRRNESSPTLWRGKMYSAATDGFVEVSLGMKDPSSLVVTFDQQDILHLKRRSTSPDKPSPAPGSQGSSEQTGR